jgi:hypothetical protein
MLEVVEDWVCPLTDHEYEETGLPVLIHEYVISAPTTGEPEDSIAPASFAGPSTKI